LTQGSSDDNQKVEEIRGLFVLGLLAVMIVIRYQNPKLPVTIGAISFDLTPFLNTTIILWSLYAFTMVLGLSSDIIGKGLADTFKGVARIFLLLDFVLLGLFSTLLGYLAFPTRLPWIFGLIVIILLFGVGIRLNSLRGKHFQPHFKKTIKTNPSSISILMLLISVAAIFYLPAEYGSYVIVPFCFGLLAIVLYFLTRKKGSSKTEQPYIN